MEDNKTIDFPAPSTVTVASELDTNDEVEFHLEVSCDNYYFTATVNDKSSIYKAMPNYLQKVSDDIYKKFIVNDTDDIISYEGNKIKILWKPSNSSKHDLMVTEIGDDEFNTQLVSDVPTHSKTKNIDLDYIIRQIIYKHGLYFILGYHDYDDEHDIVRTDVQINIYQYQSNTWTQLDSLDITEFGLATRLFVDQQMIYVIIQQEHDLKLECCAIYNNNNGKYVISHLSVIDNISHDSRIDHISNYFLVRDGDFDVTSDVKMYTEDTLQYIGTIKLYNRTDNVEYATYGDKLYIFNHTGTKFIGYHGPYSTYYISRVDILAKMRFYLHRLI